MDESLNVLIIDTRGGGEPLVSEHVLGKAIAARWVVSTVHGLESGLSELDANDRVDAVLLGLPLVLDGELHALDYVCERAQDAPILVVGEQVDDALALEAVRRGAQDCLARVDLDWPALRRSLAYGIERQRRQAELRAISLVDELTGLYNRRGFLTLARQQLRIADRMHQGVCQVYVDLDGLKKINDTFGHSVGDRALMDTALLLQQTFRDTDIVARIGGDEFAVLAVETQEPAPETLALRLLENLAAWNASSGRPYKLSFSVGMARYDSSEPRTVDELLAQADLWMYTDKRGKQEGVNSGEHHRLQTDDRARVVDLTPPATPIQGG
jgi:two-component system, cell cycle response regulator